METVRQSFQLDFRAFSQLMDIILPDSAAGPFIKDLKRLGMIDIAARNRYRDKQLDIKGIGGKVYELIGKYVSSKGVDPKIPLIDLSAGNYKEQLNMHKSSRARASEIEHAIRHHIKINLDKDPEYYTEILARLEEILRKNKERWDDLEQLILDLGKNIEPGHKKRAADLGLSENELPFYNTLMKKLRGDSSDETTIKKTKEAAKEIVKVVEEARQIVDFGDKWDEGRSLEKKIKRIVDAQFGESLARQAIEDLMKLMKSLFT